MERAPGAVQGYVLSPQQPQGVMVGTPHPMGYRVAYTPVNGAAYGQFSGMVAQPQYMTTQQLQQQQQAANGRNTGRKGKTGTGGITTVAPPPPAQGALTEPLSSTSWVPLELPYAQRNAGQMVPQQLVLMQPGQPLGATPLSPQFVISPQMAPSVPASPQIVSHQASTSTTTTTTSSSSSTGRGGSTSTGAPKARTRGTARKHH